MARTNRGATNDPEDRDPRTGSAPMTRRSFLGATGGALALGAVGPSVLRPRYAPQPPDSRHLRHPGSFPDPHRAPGTPDPAIPIDHIVIVMQENHSFDEYFGMLARQGQPLADGFTFDLDGHPINSNPLANGATQAVFHREGQCPGGSAGQSWDSTHLEINHGRMDGFAAIDTGAMGYFDQSDIPFYYSLAKTFTLANRWFSSAPCQTYPNRRFLYAGTAYGNISTSTSSFSQPPPAGGTIIDQLVKYGLSWRDYVTDLPDTAIIPSNLERYPYDYTDISQFYVDAALGTLPAVSYVDSDGGAVGIAESPLASYLSSAPFPLPGFINTNLQRLGDSGGDEEGDNVRIGETFVSRVVRAVMNGPAWHSTLLIWLYDEHGGYYDHVPVPTAIAPDDIPPGLAPGDYPGGYDMYGPRVPAVVVSPWSRPHAVTNVVHDHTSILAMIERKWNLPALTYRDANAADLTDFLDFDRLSFPTAPTLALPGAVDLRSCPGPADPPG